MHVSSSVFLILLKDLTTKDYRQNLLLEVTLQLRRLPISDRLPLSVCVRIQLPKNCDTKTKLGLKTVTPVHDKKTNHVELTELTDLCSCDKKRGHSIDNDDVFKSTTRVSLLSRQGEEVWRNVTMAEKFLDHNNRELKQRIRRRQRERQKSKWLILAKQQLCTCITLFCTFLCRRCTTTTWNFLISCARFMEWVNTTAKFSFLFF